MGTRVNISRLTPPERHSYCCTWLFVGTLMKTFGKIKKRVLDRDWFEKVTQLLFMYLFD